MSRGDVVVVIVPGDYGKPRPAVVVQTDRMAGAHSVIICPITSDLEDAAAVRVTIEPTPDNNLRRLSHAMVDKITVLHTGRVGQTIGRLDARTMAEIDERLAFVLGLGGG